MNATPPVSNHATPDGGVSGLRPLNVIAAVANGGVPQARIRRVLADLAVPLTQLHAHRGVHGGIALSTIGLDASGKAHLMQPPLEPGADADNAARIEGYAAFEQYTDDPEWPCGPWTDVYALSAVAHTMLTGTAPPPALDRCVKDTSAPLAGRDLGAYDLAFLQAVDQGLSMPLSGRPQSMEAFVQAFGLGVTLPAKETPPPSVDEAPAVQAASAAPASPPPVSPIPAAAAASSSTKAGPRVPLLVLLGVLAAIALVLYMWLRPGGPTVSSAGRDAPPMVAENSASESAAPAARTEPDPPIPTPPALSDLGGSGSGSSTEEGANASSGASTTPGATAGTATPTTAPEAAGPQASAGIDALAGAEAPAGAAPQTTPGAANETAAAGAAASESSVDAIGAGEPEVPMTVNSNLSPGAASTAPDAAAGMAGSPATPAGESTDPAVAAQAEAADAAAQAAAAKKEQAKETPPPPPPPAASGAVRVSVRPWGEVFIDGKSRGISPPLGEVKLSPGTHQVTIRNPASPDYHTTITVGRGGSGAISHVFE